jgi:hypothetical protein
MSKYINIDDVVFPTSKLEPIIISDKSYGPDVKYLVYHPDMKWTSCTFTRASKINICKHILHALHIMIDLHDL